MWCFLHACANNSLQNIYIYVTWDQIQSMWLLANDIYSLITINNSFTSHTLLSWNFEVKGKVRNLLHKSFRISAFSDWEWMFNFWQTLSIITMKLIIITMKQECHLMKSRLQNFWRTRNAAGTRADRQMFQLFQVLPSFYECCHLTIEFIISVLNRNAILNQSAQCFLWSMF